MTAPDKNAEEFRSGKGHKDENFPVASALIAPAHRAPIMAFYNFVRAADDIADHPTMPQDDKLQWLDRLEATLLGNAVSEPVGLSLRRALEASALGPEHALDLLRAFRLDVTKRRYTDWDDLIAYCRWSAMPVGRFVLDVHGESRDTWPANDALCAALQINNHLQDCGKDYRALDRVYIPLDAMAAHSATAGQLAGESSAPAMRACIAALAARNARLLAESEGFAAQIADLRLSLEVGLIHAYAKRIVALLQERDPLKDRVHLGKAEAATLATFAVTGGLLRRLFRPARHKTMHANG